MADQELHLFRDVLDKQMVDRNGRRCGKVDGLVLRTGEGPPRVARIEIGSGTLARRLSGRLARGMAALSRWLGIRGGRPYRIPWARVKEVDLNVALDLDADDSQLDAAERWVRDRVMSHLPGAR